MKGMSKEERKKVFAFDSVEGVPETTVDMFRKLEENGSWARKERVQSPWEPVDEAKACCVGMSGDAGCVW